MEIKFERNNFGKRLKSMLKVDFRRMFTMPLFYIIAGACFVAPILILVMTTMMDGTVSVNPQTGAETVMEGFDSVWQIIGSESTAESASEAAMAEMDMMSMVNINLLYFALAVFVCLFISEDFKSGYAKNLFTVRADKSDYVISKTLAGFVGGAIMIIVFFLGTMLGGAISGLPFDMGTAGISGMVMCIIAKIFLMAVFVSVYVTVSVAAKRRTWLTLLVSLGAGALLFMMIPMLTPLNSGIMNVVLCLAGGILFGAGLGAISGLILKKTNLV